MNRSIIISIGVALILIVVGIWGYLLFFGTPSDSDEVFANLGIGGDTPRGPAPAVDATPPPQNEGVTQVDTSDDALQQLTTRPVAGFAFVGTSTEDVRYVERGTGHIFEIDLGSGSERRISGTTIPRVVEAVFSDTGDSVALISEENNEQNIFAGLIGETDEQIDYISLPDNAIDPVFATRYRLQYGVVTESGIEGYELDVRDNTPLRLFSIPLRDATLLWKDDIYVFNRPSRQLQGALYQIGSGLTPVVPKAYGFLGGVSDAHYFTTGINENSVFSNAIDRSTGQVQELVVTYVPEKCGYANGATTTLWCAAPLDLYEPAFFEDWYKGLGQSEDFLWSINIPRGEARLFVDFLQEAGRVVDVNRLVVGDDNERILLRNKVDSTLWLYDATLR